VLYLAEIDNEEEATGKKQQKKWEAEMQDLEKYRQWQKKYTVPNKKPAKAPESSQAKPIIMKK
jgi:hypothetical protein